MMMGLKRGIGGPIGRGMVYETSPRGGVVGVEPVGL